MPNRLLVLLQFYAVRGLDGGVDPCCSPNLCVLFYEVLVRMYREVGEFGWC